MAITCRLAWVALAAACTRTPARAPRAGAASVKPAPVVLAAPTPTKTKTPVRAFGAPRLSKIDGWPSGLAFGDLDEDGVQDLVSLQLGPGTKTYLGSHRGDGKGAFAAFPTGHQIGDMVSGIAVVDLDEDGHLDVIAPRYYEKDLALYSGDGKGDFAKPRHVATRLKPTQVVTGYIDGDQHVDVLVSYFGHLQVFLGDGRGNLSAKRAFKIGQAPDGTMLTDVNADGKTDLYLVLNDENRFLTLIGAGDGTFGTPISRPTCGSPSYAQVGDFDSDGAPDLAYACITDGIVEVQLSRRGKKSGLDFEHVQFTASPIEDFVAADFSGDGVLDVLSMGRPQVLNTSLRLHLGDGKGGFTLHCEGRAAADVNHPVAADFDGDQRLDLAATYWLGREPGSGALWSAPCR